MAFFKVGDPDTQYYIKPNEDGSINMGAGSVVLDATDIQIGAVEIKDDDTGSRMDVVSAGVPTNYIGAQIISGAAIVGSFYATNLDSGSVLNTSLAASAEVIGSVYVRELEAGTNVIGSTIVADGGASLTVDVGTALPAGTNLLGSVYAAQAVTGSVYFVDEEATAAATWVESISVGVIDTNITYSGTAGSVFAYVRTI